MKTTKRRAKDRVGEVFGRLTVEDCYKKDGRSWYKCSCSCGNKDFHVVYHSVTGGKASSCGCSRRSMKIKSHGMSKDKVYRAWVSMKGRVNCKTHTSYPYYGGRGISYCEKWESFEGFFEDMGLPPSADHTLDRIDNDKDYSKSNCRWETRSVQMKNQGKRSILTASSCYKGVIVDAGGNCDVCVTLKGVSIRFRVSKDEELAAKYFNYLSKYLYSDQITLNNTEDLTLTVQQAEFLNAKVEDKFYYSQELREYSPIRGK